MFDPKRSKSLTAIHKQDWQQAGLESLEISINQEVSLAPPRANKPESTAILLYGSKAPDVKKYDTLEGAMEQIQKLGQNMAVLDFNLEGAEEKLQAMTSHKIAGEILASEALASYALLKYSDRYTAVFAGSVIDVSGKPIRVYTLRALS
jgi:hypothetical protein